MIKFYAVHIGRRPGVYKTWEECRAQTDRYSRSRFRTFPNLAEAQYFVKHGYDPLPYPKITDFFKRTDPVSSR